jgi:hypothetical protein
MQMLDPWRREASHFTDPAPGRGPEGATPRRLRKRQRLKRIDFALNAGSSRWRMQLPCLELTSD